MASRKNTHTSGRRKKRKLKLQSKTQRQKLLAGIDIYEQSIVASIYDDCDDVVQRSFVSIGDILNMLGSMKNSVPQWFTVNQNILAIGITPEGTQRYVILRKSQKTKICCEIGGKARIYQIHMPELVAILSAEYKGGKLKFTGVDEVYACRCGGKLKADTQLYVAPLPNVYSSGKVCMGSVRTNQWSSLIADEFFEKAFFATTFTDHIDGDQLEGKKYRNILHAIKETHGRIPLKLLKKVKKYGQIFKD
jgi:hypothetical protein